MKSRSSPGKQLKLLKPDSVENYYPKREPFTKQIFIGIDYARCKLQYAPLVASSNVCLYVTKATTAEF